MSVPNPATTDWVPLGSGISGPGVSPVIAAATSILSLTTSYQNVPGVNIDASVPLGAAVVARATVDVDTAGMAAGILIVDLLVDGGAVGGEILLNPSTAGGMRVTLGQHWVLPGLSAGSHNFKLQARTSGGGGSLNSSHTRLAVDVVAATSPVMASLPYATSLPTAPYDGQEAILVDSVTNPSYVWRLRYNAGSSSAYKWEFVGGSPAYAEWKGAQAVSAGWTKLPSAGTTTVTVPRAGDYDVTYGAGGQIETAVATDLAVGIFNAAGTQLGTNDWQDCMARVTGTVYDKWDIGKSHRLAGLAAGTALDVRGTNVSGSTVLNFLTSYISAVPKRVS